MRPNGAFRIERRGKVNAFASPKNLAARWTLAAAAALVLCVASPASHCEEESAPRYGTRTFNSELRLTVHVKPTGSSPEEIGETPAEEPIAIPECEYWWVEPEGEVDWQALVQEVRRHNIPGLRVPLGATDRHLAHLEGLENLQVLVLGWTQVTDEGLAYLRGLKNLRVLRLRNTKVTDEGMAFDPDLQHGLREVWVGDTEVSAEGLAHLQGLENLRVLDLSGTEVTDEGLAHPEGLKNLRVLGLGDTKVTDEGMAHLQGLQNLHQLVLVGTAVTDEGLAHLQGLKSLRVLRLRETKVTDEGLAPLTGLKNLRVLNLSRTKATDEGVRRLKEALPQLYVYI